jgi:hypothetical protein
LNNFIKDKLDILNKFIKEKIMLNNNEKEFKYDLPLGDFYLYFLDHNLNGKYSLLINDIIVLILNKIINIIKLFISYKKIKF